MDGSTGYEHSSAPAQGYTTQDGQGQPRSSSARGRRQNLSEPRTRTPPRDGNAVQRQQGQASSSTSDSQPTASLRTNSRPASVPKNKSPPIGPMPFPTTWPQRHFISYGPPPTAQAQDTRSEGAPEHTAARSRSHEKRRKLDPYEVEIPSDSPPSFQDQWSNEASSTKSAALRETEELHTQEQNRLIADHAKKMKQQEREF